MLVPAEKLDATDLVTSLGFNNQPVGASEIKGILAEAEKAKPSPTNIYVFRDIHSDEMEQGEPSEAKEAAPLFTTFVSDFLETNNDRVITHPDGTQLLEWDGGDPDEQFHIAISKPTEGSPKLKIEQAEPQFKVSFEISKKKLESSLTSEFLSEESDVYVYPEYMKVIRRFIKDHPLPPKAS